MNVNPHIRFLLNPSGSPPPEDWYAFERLVSHHRNFHTLETVFRKYPDQIPLEVKSRLKLDLQDQLQHQLLLATELQSLVQELNASKINYFHLKGTSLALLLYNKISARFARDIDFLVDEKDIDPALEIFKSLGYRIIQKEKKNDPEHFRKIKKNQTLIHSQKRIVLEIHWDLFSNRHFYIHQDKFLEQSGLIDLNGTPVRIMNRENTFIYLCLHGAYHEYFRLFWLRDLAEILKNWNLPWKEIIDRCKREDILRIVASSALLAGKIYKFSTPFDGFLFDPKIQWLANHNLSVINRSSLPTAKDRAKRIIYFIRLKRNLKYKAECIFGVAKRYRIQ